MEKVLGIHYIIDIYKCDESIIKNSKTIKVLMDEICEKVKLNVVDKKLHDFNPYGTSGAYILKESHFTIHTWPEYNYVAVDLFFCDLTIDIDFILRVIKEEFKTNEIKIKKIERG